MLNANRDKFVASDQQLQDIRFAQRELERLKIQFRDERNAWQKQNYIDARIEQKLDLLEKQLSDLGKVNFSKHNDVSISSDNDMLVILSDLHIGQTFHSFFGEYNTDIAKDRMQQLLDNIISIQKLHNSEPITLTSLSIVISLQFPHIVRFTDTVLSLEFKDGTALALFKIFATPDILPNAKIFMYLLLSIYNIPVI